MDNKKLYPPPPGWRFQVFDIVDGLAISNRVREPTDFDSLGVDAIVCLEDWDYAWSPPVPQNHLYLHVPIDDDDTVDPKTREGARFVAQLVQGQSRVLVHCTEGLNRSALVAARALMFLGYEAQDAIDLVRAKRGDDDGLPALGNRSFEQWLLAEGAVSD